MLIPFGVFSAGAGGGASAGSFELISTTLISTNTASITFDTTGLGSTYKHLQIRWTARVTGANDGDGLRVRFNSDTGNNYSYHQLFGAGSIISNGGSSANAMFIQRAATTDAASGIFGAGVADILDAFSTTKNKTIRELGGYAGFGAYGIFLDSGAWYNTAAITGITIYPNLGTNFVSGSRFSLYGIKG